MRPRSLHVFSLGLMLALTLGPSLAAPPGAAETIDSHATVRNIGPEIVTFEVLLDARLGAFVYSVQARDGNGAPDLDRAIFHFIDADDRLWTHRDDAWSAEGANGTVSGIAHVGSEIWRGPFRVHLHVYDRHDAEAEADAPVTRLSGPLDTVRDARGGLRGSATPGTGAGTGTSLMPLDARVAGVAPPHFGALLIGGLFLFALVGVAHAATRPPSRQAPPQRGRGRSPVGGRRSGRDRGGPPRGG